MRISVFVDSDVVVSSIISEIGAAHILINEKFIIEKFVSDRSVVEIRQVSYRLRLSKIETEKALSGFKLVKNSDIKKFREYIFDDFDEPIINGAVEAKAKFLVTYNLKHYNLEKIKRDLDILVMSPGKFLQYLRSVNLQ